MTNHEPAGDRTDPNCVFCAIVAGTGSARIVREDDDTLAFLALGQAVAGHTLIVPKVHAVDLLDIEPDSLAAVARATQDVARLIEDRLQPDGLSLFQNNRRAGWQSVFHFHMHVVPRYVDDGLIPPWRESPATDTALDEVGRRLGAREQRSFTA